MNESQVHTGSLWVEGPVEVRSTSISFKVTPDEYWAIKKEAVRRRETLSSFLRMLLKDHWERGDD